MGLSWEDLGLGLGSETMKQGSLGWRPHVPEARFPHL